MPRRSSVNPLRFLTMACGCGLLLATLTACELSPFPSPSGGNGDAGADPGSGGNDPGGGLMPIGGNGGGDEIPPCGDISDAGAFVSQMAFSAAGHERIDATHVGNDGAAWLALAYDEAFTIEDLTLAAPEDRDIILLRVIGGETIELHRVHGPGDQRVRVLQQDDALHVVGTVSDAAGGGNASLHIDGVSYDGFADGDAFYIHIFGEDVEVYRLTGDVVNPKGITIDSLGHAWLVGDFEGSLTLSGTPNASGIQGTIKSVTGTSPNSNGFAARLAFGAERLTAFGPPAGEGTSADAARVVGVIPFDEDGGEVIVFGDFRGQLQLGNGKYDVEGASDLFLGRVEPDGTVSDRSHYRGPGDAYASSILVTPGGRGVIVGTYSGDLGWADPPHGNSGLFISQVKLRDLKRGRAREFSAPTGELIPTSLARYPWGNGIIVAGKFTGESFPLVGDILTNTDTTPDAFVLALENDLDDRYGWHLETTGTAEIHDVSTAPCQAAAIVGSFEGGSITARRLSSSDSTVSFSDATQLDAFLLRLSY